MNDEKNIRQILRDKTSKFVYKIKSDKFYAYKIGSIVLLLLFILLLHKVFLFIVLFCITIGISLLAGTTPLYKFGLETITLFTVLGSIIGGPSTGLLLGVCMITLHLICTATVGVFILWAIPLYGLMGLIAGLAGPTVPIETLGMSLTIGYHVACVLLGLLFESSKIIKYFFYAGSNILLNYVLFHYFAPPLLYLLQV